MKILIPIIGFGKAGGYRVLSQLANCWIGLGHHVTFLVDERSTLPYFPTEASIFWFDKKGNVQTKKSASSENKYSSKGNALSIYKNMWRALRKIAKQYDVVLANHSLTAYPVFLTPIKNTRKLYYVQAYEPEYYSEKKDIKSFFLRMVSSFSYRLPLRKITNAPIYLNYKNLKSDHWVPPGIDEKVFFRRIEVPRFDSDAKVCIGVIGRLEPEKGTRFVLDAFTSLANRNDSIVLKIAYGNVPVSWNHDRAHIVIPANDKELAEYYRSVDILIAPGTLQLGACHYPVLEAMACGTPVITTGYLPANPSNAWLVDVGSSRDIERAVEQIMSTPSDQLRTMLDKAHKDVADFYWSNVSAKFLELMD